jgi:hypothetical protein
MNSATPNVETSSPPLRKLSAGPCRTPVGRQLLGPTVVVGRLLAIAAVLPPCLERFGRPLQAADWTTYQHDAARSGVTDEEVRSILCGRRLPFWQAGGTAVYCTFTSP